MKQEEIKIILVLNKEGMLTNKEISKKTKTDHWRVSRALDKLEKDGLIESLKGEKKRLNTSLTRIGEKYALFYKKMWRYYGK